MDTRKSLEDMQAEVLEVNTANGWYERDVPFPEAMALVHAEVSEALEAWRKWGVDDATELLNATLCRAPKPEGAGSEFADIFIRLLDYCHRYGIDLRAEYERKIQYNRTRGYRHGNKVI